MKNLWNNNKIQFARLISELEAVGAFTPQVTQDLCAEMDLTVDDLSELVDRAQLVFDASKELI